MPLTSSSGTLNENVKQHSGTVRRTIHFYWQVTKVQWPMFALSVLSTLGFVFFLSYANPWVVARIIDRIGASHVSSSQVISVFGPYILLLIAINIIGQASSKLQDYSVWKLELKANYLLATQAFDTLSNQSMTFHQNQFGGSLVSQTQKYIGAYATLLESIIYSWFAIIGSAVFTIVMLAPVVPSYVIILLFLLAIYIAAAVVMFKKILPLNAKAAQQQNRLSGELSDSIMNILTVKTYGREDYERTIFDEANESVLDADTKRMWSTTVRNIVTSGIIVLIMMVVVIFVAGGNAWFGISAGALVMMFTYTYQLTNQFNRISQTLAMTNRGLGDAQAMVEILDEPRLVQDSPESVDIDVCCGEIEFCDVTFKHTDERDQLFEHFNLKIPAGQRVGLVGRSGAGKSTLTTLLLRLSDLESGDILIDGYDIADVTQVSLRRNVAYVPQEPLLFHRSIRDNIAYGKPDATDEEVREAARRANALDFIEQLSDGFDSVAGERGIKLSGGQRQRIAIARAVLKDAPILVLDEATSALDSESERLIQEALANLMRNRTSIVVAHRLSTVASLDRIIVLSDGAIVEDGSHEELVAAGGEYAYLWNRQSGAFLSAD
ncbi:MAG: ABC transporter ATP-binding protein/permease [Coriobacteriia bacterium]|nr:ABC transporter ATP-binding protein/permease [Coriobacteriia bacterium]